MKMSRIEKTTLWKSTLSLITEDEFQSERERLRSAFVSLRKKTKDLVAQIGKALPELTQHDISHIDALWETASIIVGEGYELSPLEGFVLGAAFLLHDSALCFEAFENGRTGLRATIQWKDAFAEINESNPTFEVSEIEKHADFATLRNLHALQAEKLLFRNWRDDRTSNEIYLLEDQDLRNHLGKLIGQIASSHHWDIETVVAKFNGQLNVPSGFPREWRIDPVKLAFILRCADAAHLDNERAPDFLHVLLKRSGISYEHWIAQNRLAKVDIDQTDSDKSTLLFTSTIDFKEVDAKAWFVAYDAICLVDKEIRSCNTQLEKLGKQCFRVKKVKGVESPESLAVYIKAESWEPCSAKVHVGNVEKIIQTLGGEMLYGVGTDHLEIVLREMIQNARDAIKARSVFDSINEGKISISLTKDAASTWITIEDNGIGMSERILTGPLLDFGTSFWTSSLVQTEFPGLRASKFKSVGKFGIGFYSVFMLADEVFVASRTYLSGVADVCQLKFTEGFSLRPILTKGAPQRFNTTCSTQIKIKIKPDIIPEDFLLEIKNNRADSINFKVPFKDYIAALCAGLDVPVYYKGQDGNEIKIHEDINSLEFNKLLWLKQISFAEYQVDSEIVKQNITKNISRLKPIVDDGIIRGIAAIPTEVDYRGQNFLSLTTVGGLAFSIHNRTSDRFIGYLDYTPKSAKREIDQFTASKKVVEVWANEQLRELISLNLSSYERYVASASLCSFSVDPSELAHILVDFNGRRMFLTFNQMAELSLNMKFAFLKSNITQNEHIEMFHSIQELLGYALILPLMNSSFLSLKRNNGIPVNNFSILDCLYKSIINLGNTPILDEISNVGTNQFGSQINALILSSSK